MTWFNHLTGFTEESPDQVRSQLDLRGTTIVSKVNQRVMTCGRIEIPSLRELRERLNALPITRGRISLREVVADIRELHLDPANAGAFFQVASQFNLLEMVSPDRTPEDGVGIYQYDKTQGPACAEAAGAGTIYRNYFARVDGVIGQNATNQINCLADIGYALDNSENRLWEMKNGYALATAAGLAEITTRLTEANETDLDQLRGRLRIGIQSDTEVTMNDAGHLVSQAYCSALPVAYCAHPRDLWGAFAQLILEAAYEATLCAALLNADRTGKRTVFLTLLGGGAFGNSEQWIFSAIQRAVDRFREVDLDLAIVSYGWSNPGVRDLITRLQP